MGEFDSYNKRGSQIVLVNEEKDNRKREIYRFFIVFTGTISIISLIISMFFFTQVTTSGYLAGRVVENNFISSEGNVYGLIIIVLISLAWTVQMLIWYKRLMEK